MNRVPKNPLGDSQDWDVTVLDESQLKPRSEPETPERILASWRENMKYMEKLKKYRPQEYEEIMKEREAKGIKPPRELDQPS
jgi:hypothetical protein